MCHCFGNEVRPHTVFAYVPKRSLSMMSSRFSGSSLPPSAFPLQNNSGVSDGGPRRLTAAGTAQDSHLFPSRGSKWNRSLEIAAKIRKIRDFCIFAPVFTRQ